MRRGWFRMGEFKLKKDKFQKEKDFIYKELPALENDLKRQLAEIETEIDALENQESSVIKDFSSDKARINFCNFFKKNEESLETKIVQKRVKADLIRKKISNFKNLEFKDSINFSDILEEAASNLDKFDKVIYEAEKEAKRIQDEYIESIKKFKSLLSERDQYTKDLINFEAQIEKHDYELKHKGSRIPFNQNVTNYERKTWKLPGYKSDIDLTSNVTEYHKIRYIS